MWWTWSAPQDGKSCNGSPRDGGHRGILDHQYIFTERWGGTLSTDPDKTTLEGKGVTFLAFRLSVEPKLLTEEEKPKTIFLASSWMWPNAIPPSNICHWARKAGLNCHPRRKAEAHVGDPQGRGQWNPCNLRGPGEEEEVVGLKCDG